MPGRNDDLLFLAGMVVGATIGGMLAVLLTPQHGPTMRENVHESGLELKNRDADAVQRAQQVASDAVAKVQETAHDLINQPHSDLPSAEHAN